MIKTITAVYLRVLLIATISISILCSVLFYSCSENSIVQTQSKTPNTNDYYIWSVETADLEGITSVSGTGGQAGSNPIYAGGIKSYRILNGVKKEINFNDEKFIASEVKAFNKDYAVFLGYKNFPPDTAYFKIYDNDVIKSYSTKLEQTDYLQGIYIIDKNNFFVANEGPLCYYEFKDSEFKRHMLPNNFTPLKFTKLNGELLLTARYENNSFNTFFKIAADGTASILRSEEPNGRIFYLNNDIIKVTEDNMLVEFSYFTSTAWTKFYSSWRNSNGEKAVYLTGESKDFFSVMTVDNQYNIHVNVWNGKEYTEQDNFPSGLTAFETLGTVSDYNNGAFYFYYSSAKKLFKALKNN